MNNFLDWLIDILRHKRNKSDISGLWYNFTDVLYYIRFLRYRSKAWCGMDAALSFDDWRKGETDARSKRDTRDVERRAAN